MTKPLNVVSLFAGIGGIDLGLERAGMRTVGQVEIDPYCRQVLAKHWPGVPRHDDVRTAIDWWLSRERPSVDLVCGGFPCTDIAAPGRRTGIVDGSESGLWAPMARFVRALRPRYVLVENSPRVLVRARDGFIPLEVIAADLAALGYDLEWDCIPAAAVGAPHLRDRWFGIAYADGEQLRVESVSEPRCAGEAIAGADGAPGAVADASGRGRRADQRDVHAGQPDAARRRTPMADPDCHQRRPRPNQGPEVRAAEAARFARFYVTEPDDGGWWRTEPDVGRVVDGLPGRMDRPRKRSLGNAVVPQVAEYAGRLIVDHHERAA